MPDHRIIDIRTGKPLSDIDERTDALTPPPIPTDPGETCGEWVMRVENVLRIHQKTLEGFLGHIERAESEIRKLRKRVARAERKTAWWRL